MTDRLPDCVVTLFVGADELARQVVLEGGASTPIVGPPLEQQHVAAVLESDDIVSSLGLGV